MKARDLGHGRLRERSRRLPAVQRLGQPGDGVAAVARQHDRAARLERRASRHAHPWRAFLRRTSAPSAPTVLSAACPACRKAPPSTVCRRCTVMIAPRSRSNQVLAKMPCVMRKRAGSDRRMPAQVTVSRYGYAARENHAPSVTSRFNPDDQSR